jgi:methanogenic corrinoid protein MtbC1
VSVGEIVLKTGLSQPNISNHLARLREHGLVSFHRNGKRVYYEMANPELVRTLLALPGEVALTPDEIEETIADVAPRFEEAALSVNEEAARGMVNRALARGVPWQQLYTHVFEPALIKVGALWSCGALAVSEEHATCQVIDRIIHHVAALRVPASPGGPVTVVVSCIEGERHHLGARMLADFLADAGHNVAFLGADLPNASLIAYVVRHRPAAVCVSASTLDRESAVRDLAERMRNLPPGVQAPRLLLGGRLLQVRPELAEECNAVRVAPTVQGAIGALNGKHA